MKILLQMGMEVYYTLEKLEKAGLFSTHTEKYSLKWKHLTVWTPSQLTKYRVRQQKPDAQNFNSKETFKKQF